MSIVRIALTHAHGDHVGGLDHLAPALPDAEVLISARDARLLGKDMTPDPGEPADAKMRLPGNRHPADRLARAGPAGRDRSR